MLPAVKYITPVKVESPNADISFPDDGQSEPYTHLPTHIVRKAPKSDRSY